MDHQNPNSILDSEDIEDDMFDLHQNGYGLRSARTDGLAIHGTAYLVTSTFLWLVFKFLHGRQDEEDARDGDTYTDEHPNDLGKDTARQEG